MSKIDLSRMRVEYGLKSLSQRDLDPDPIQQLARWLEEAITANVMEPNAMTLATSDGVRPSARVVLLKRINADGLVFCTNYHSRKANELDANPHAALVFWWPELERQVRVEGTISRTSPQESEEFFNLRPPGSRLGAAASPQSQVIASRAELEARLAELSKKYPRGDIPRPGHWGGYCLRPRMIEFWQGGKDRLHDRLEYTLNDPAGWIVRRLAP